MFVDSSVKMIYVLEIFNTKLMKSAKMADDMHEADYTYSIWSTWWLHALPNDVPFVAFVIGSAVLLLINWTC